MTCLVTKSKEKEKVKLGGYGGTVEVWRRAVGTFLDRQRQAYRGGSGYDSEQRLAWNGRDRDGRQVPAGSYLYVVYDGETAFHTGSCGVIR